MADDNKFNRDIYSKFHPKKESIQIGSTSSLGTETTPGLKKAEQTEIIYNTPFLKIFNHLSVETSDLYLKTLSQSKHQANNYIREKLPRCPSESRSSWSLKTNISQTTLKLFPFLTIDAG